MNPMKMLNAFGETGLISTNKGNLHKKILMLRHAGTIKDPKKIEISKKIKAEHFPNLENFEFLLFLKTSDNGINFIFKHPVAFQK